MAGSIEDDKHRSKALATLAPQLAVLSSATRILREPREALPILAERTRKQLLADLGALVPVIEALGGAEAVEEAVQAVQDVGWWWP